MPATLPPLSYAYEALEPIIDAATMHLHHDKHHQTYVTNFNNAIAGKPDLENRTAEDLLRSITSVPEDVRTAVRNNGGGTLNHSFFWTLLAPKGNGGGGEPTAAVGEAIKAAFGSFADFKAKFQDAGAKRFGSGWVWLIVKDGKLAITSTPNQDTPIMPDSVLAPSGALSGTPILTVDLWEHAYYLKYQNRRPEYLAAIWDVINWARVGELYAGTKK